MAEPSKSGYRYNYQYGTEAPKYPYPTPQTTPTPDFTPLRRPKTQPRKKLDIGYTMKLTLCGGLVFAACIGFVRQTSVLSAKQSELKAVTSQIRETQSNINNVEAIIATQLDLEQIQSIAKSELHMSEPLPHQIVYLSLPQESYTTYND